MLGQVRGRRLKNMKDKKFSVLAFALLLSGAADASASFSFSIGLPSVSVWTRPAPVCEPVSQILRDGRRVWVNDCSALHYAMPVYTQPVYVDPVYNTYYYYDAQPYGSVTYSYPLRRPAPAVYQMPGSTTIFNNDPYRW